MSAAAAMRAFNASGKVQACYRRPPDLSGSTLHAPFRVTTHRGHTVQTFQSLELALETAQSLDPDHYVIDGHGLQILAVIGANERIDGPMTQIGRASCRERVEIAVGRGAA